MVGTRRQGHPSCRTRTSRGAGKGVAGAYAEGLSRASVHWISHPKATTIGARLATLRLKARFLRNALGRLGVRPSGFLDELNKK